MQASQQNESAANLFRFVFVTTFYRKFVDFSGIRTEIVGKVGEHADHRGSYLVKDIYTCTKWGLSLLNDYLTT